MPNLVRINIIGEAGAGKSTLAAGLAEEGFEVFRPSDVIRAFAQAHSFELRGRHDYVAAHRLMVAEDQYAMIRPLLERDPGDVAIDGLRVLAHANLLERELDMHTIALDKPPDMTDEAWALECYERVQASKELRSYRDKAIIDNFAAFQADVAADRVPGNEFEPNISDVMAMAQTRGLVIHANQPPETVLEQAAVYIAAIR
jgi:adenylate kinase family enzyme